MTLDYNHSKYICYYYDDDDDDDNGDDDDDDDDDDDEDDDDDGQRESTNLSNWRKEAPNSISGLQWDIRTRDLRETSA